MLDKKVFLKGLAHLKRYYLNFQLDLTDQKTVEVWYLPLQTLENDEFEILLKTYMENNLYPPTSPTSFVNEYKQAIINQFNAHSEFEKLKGYVKTTWNAKTLKNDFNGIAYECAKVFAPQLVDVYTNNIPFIRKDYVEMFEREIKLFAKEQTKLKLGSGLKLIEWIYLIMKNHILSLRIDP